VPGFDLPWRLLPETKQAISRGLDHLEEAGQATWTKLQRGLVEAGTSAMNAVAMSGATSAGFSPAAAMYRPMQGQDVGEDFGLGEAFSPEALAREDALGPVASVATDLVAGIPTAFAGGAGAAADVASAKAEAERAGMSPAGQAATTLLAGAPIIGAGTARKIVRELGGGTAKKAQDEFAQALQEAATPPVPTHSLPEGALPSSRPTPLDTSPEPPGAYAEGWRNGVNLQDREAALGQTIVPTMPPWSKTRHEGIRWTEEHLKSAPDQADGGDIERFMTGLSDDS
jgi:hypothetical protein